MGKEVVITAGVRSAIGTFGGALKDYPAPDLGALVVKEALTRSKVDPKLVDDVIIGNCMMRPDEYTIGRFSRRPAGGRQRLSLSRQRNNPR